MKRRLLLVAPRYSYRIAAYLEAAERLDLALSVASDGRHSLVGALRDGIHADLDDLAGARERILAALASTPVHGVVGTDDKVMELAASLAACLAVPGNPAAAARLTRRKDLARRALAAAGVPVPEHEVLALAAAARGVLPHIDFPLVVKPLSMSASRGVIRADDAAQFREACARVRRIVVEAGEAAARDCVLVERYLPGAEIALEGLLSDGELRVLAVFDKPEPLTGPYFEESYYVTPSRLPAAWLQEAARVVAAGCAAYGLRTGPVHAELRIDAAGVISVLEIAARTIGGQCARLLEFATGRSLEELVVANALGDPPPPTAEPRGAGVLMIPIARGGVLRRVEGVLAAERVPGIESVELWLREGSELVPLPEGASYLGFIFATGGTPQAAEAALREAHACLRVVVAPRWEIAAA